MPQNLACYKSEYYYYNNYVTHTTDMETHDSLHPSSSSEEERMSQGNFKVVFAM